MYAHCCMHVDPIMHASNQQIIDYMHCFFKFKNYIGANNIHASAFSTQRASIFYCILRGQIKGFNGSITSILFEVGSYRTVVG